MSYMCCQWKADIESDRATIETGVCWPALGLLWKRELIRTRLALATPLPFSLKSLTFAGWQTVKWHNFNIKGLTQCFIMSSMSKALQVSFNILAPMAGLCAATAQCCVFALATTIICIPLLHAECTTFFQHHCVAAAPLSVVEGEFMQHGFRKKVVQGIKKKKKEKKAKK